MRSTFNLLMQPFIYIVLFSCFCLLIVPPSLIALPFSRRVRLKITSRFWVLFFTITTYTVSFFKFHKEDRRDEMAKSHISPPGLYIANHQSFMDIPLTFSAFIIPPIMKKSLIYIPVFGLCAYSSGAILVDRKNQNSRKKALKAAMLRLKQGYKNMMYYPEVTRNKNSSAPKQLEDIKTPIMKYAYENQVDIYPVSLYGTDKSYQNRLLSIGNPLGMILHEALSPSNYETKDDFIKAAWEKVHSGYYELQEKLKSV